MARRLVPILMTLSLLASGGVAYANTSHAGWPQITGVLLMNKRDQSRPLDARPGHDPFDGTDSSYSCDGVHSSHSCVLFTPLSDTSSVPACLPSAPDVPGLPNVPSLPNLPKPPSVPSLPLPSLRSATESACRTPSAPKAVRLLHLGHNELLGGHGDNTIYAGPAGDVIWGDYKPSGDPTTQVNHLYGGPGNDFIYAAHGTNYIWTGGGVDVVHAHFGGGEIHCQSSTVTVYLSHMSRPHYKLFGCRHISYKTLGY